MKNNMTKTQELSQRQFLQQFQKHALSAMKKAGPDELTQDEASAICMFAGVPFVTQGEGEKIQIEFEPCQLVKEAGRWTAYWGTEEDGKNDTN